MIWPDNSSHEKFFEYYAAASQSPDTRQRFQSIRNMMLRVLDLEDTTTILEVADIGCGAGTQSLIWAASGHHVHGLDVNQRLLELAKQRAADGGYSIDFRLGSATELPWNDASMDVCLVPELLEHVTRWFECLKECSRILRPGGVLFLTTTNKLCPVQQEFNLPMYSWYPAVLKRYCEQLATTTRPQLANFAKYPAVNWFSFYSLRRVLARLGFHCFDRFDVVDLLAKGPITRRIIQCIRTSSILRVLAHVATPSTIIIAVKREEKLVRPPVPLLEVQ